MQTETMGCSGHFAEKVAPFPMIESSMSVDNFA